MIVLIMSTWLCDGVPNHGKHSPMSFVQRSRRRWVRSCALALGTRLSRRYAKVESWYMS